MSKYIGGDCALLNIILNFMSIKLCIVDIV